MSCSKSHENIKGKGVMHKVGFYTFRVLLFVLSLIVVPFIPLVALVLIFENIVLGNCPNNSVIISPFKKKKEGGPVIDEDIELVNSNSGNGR